MATLTKDELVSLRLTGPEKRELEQTAALCGMGTAPLAATFVREGMRQRRFPAIDFREGEPGRVAYLAGSRWPVWMIVDLAREHDGDIAAAAGQMQKPQALVRMALAYAAAYPEDIEACLKLHADRDFAGLQRVIPTLEQL